MITYGKGLPPYSTRFGQYAHQYPDEPFRSKPYLRYSKTMKFLAEPTPEAHESYRDNLKRDAPVAQLDRVNASEALGHKFPAAAGCRAHNSLPWRLFTYSTAAQQNDITQVRPQTWSDGCPSTIPVSALQPGIAAHGFLCIGKSLGQCGKHCSANDI